jgi:hypothetical protein
MVEGGQIGYPGGALVFDRGQQPGLGKGQRQPGPLRRQPVEPGHHGKQVSTERRSHAP